jgi:hypothetical protein
LIIETIPNPAWYIYWGNCTSMGKIPDPEWKPTRAWAERMLHSMDSTIELFDLYIFDDNCRGDVSAHIVRATKGHPRFVVQSRREDWTGQKRKPLDEVQGLFLTKVSPYGLIEIARQRMCTTASLADRVWMNEVWAELLCSGDIFLQTLADFLVPDCVFRGNVCHKPLKKCCGMCKHYSQ